MNLSICIHRFFGQYLTDIKGVSVHTLYTYRDALKLLLPYAADYHGVKIKSLQIEHLSFDLVLSFLNHLEKDRNNIVRTRNNRLAAIKSLAKMIRLLYPEHRDIAERIINIQQKRAQKTLIGYLTHQEVMTVFDAVDLKKPEGFRDYTMLHLLYDSGARASEIAGLKIDYFDLPNKTMTILGKGNRYRQVELWPKTIQLIKKYISDYRKLPKSLYGDTLFTNQRREALTRFGIHHICQKYLKKTLPEKRLKTLNPAHSFRHACAVNMLQSGHSLTDIRLRLGHEHLESTMTYLNLGISRKREIQDEFIKHTQSVMSSDKKLDKLIDWDNREDILIWLDSL